MSDTDDKDDGEKKALTIDEVYEKVERHETDSGYATAVERAAARFFRKQQAKESKPK